MTATTTPISEKQVATSDRIYLPTMDGDVVQIGVQRAIVLTLEAARDFHLPWVEKMAGREDVSYPDYWVKARDDLRWAVGGAEARQAETAVRV